CEKGQELFQFIGQNCGTPDAPQSTGNRVFRDFLPRPCFNVLEGGRHAGNALEIQEFMAVPFLESFKENLRAASEIYYHLKMMLIKNFGDLAMNTGYESGFAPPLKKTEQALDFLEQAINKAGYYSQTTIGLDVAASELFYKGQYRLNGELQKPKKILDYYEKICLKHPMIFLEDPFSEDDEASWQEFHAKLKTQSSKLLIVGDDLTVTNPDRIQQAKDKGLCEGVIIKLNQIGTVSQTIDAVNLAKSFDWKVIVSNRSGETNDDFIADFAVGVGADFIKAGAPAGGERVAKYNRLLEIEKILNSKL
ncbi:MAG: phosphopyruvate hydratase, partial [Candidatus Pacebacteria bacterium]|nr:phosphopyruvate hydratase [Candidatus Paceibacterota bacterium]